MMLSEEAASGTTRVVRDAAEETGAQPLQLLVLEPGGVSVFPLEGDGPLSVGRADECHVQLRDPLASRRHATLRTRPLRIEDHGSANGTCVGGDRIEPGVPCLIQRGQSVSIGNSLLIIRSRDEAAAAPSVDEAGNDGSPVVISAEMKRLYETLERVATSPISVLVLGETGAGKEVVAEAIHRGSPRRDAKLVRVNCAAVSDSLFESELFGYERGAFTGAVSTKQGLIEVADQGTLFLDEVGELGASAQAKLLRVIEAREVTRVGGLHQRPVDVRFVAATNRDLEREVALGRFRADLFFRLNGVSLTVPPLRARRDEIVPLAEGFLSKIAGRLGLLTRPRLGPSATRLLLSHSWPGNVRELRNAVERAAVLCTGSLIEAHDLALSSMLAPGSAVEGATAPTTVAPAADILERQLGLGALDGARSRERERIIDALNRCNGNQTRAAVLLDMPRRTLVAKLAALQVPRPRKLD